MFRDKAIVLCNVDIVISCRVYFGAPQQFSKSKLQPEYMYMYVSFIAFPCMKYLEILIIEIVCKQVSKLIYGRYAFSFLFFLFFSFIDLFCK